MKNNILKVSHLRGIQLNFFIIIITVNLLYLNMYLGVVFTVIFIFIMPNIIYPLLFIFPVIKTTLVLPEGFTITKLIGVLYLFYFFSRIYSGKIKKIIMNKQFLTIFFYIILILLGIFNFLIYNYENVHLVYDINLKNILNENINNIFRIFFAIILFIDFANMEINYLKKIIINICISITIIILPICIYNIFWGLKSWVSWHVTRSTLIGTSPGEYSYLLSILVPFVIYCLINTKNIILKFISISSLMGIVYLISITISRGGVLSFIFAIIISIFLLNENLNKKTIYLILIFVIVFLLISTGIINLDYWILRNKTMAIDIATFSSGRYDFLIAGLKYSFSNFKRLIFGGGSCSALDRWINWNYCGKANVMHSIYIGNLVKYGLFGLLIFCTIIGRIFYMFFKNKSFFINNNFKVLIVPFLSLMVALYAGLFVSWEFREILWILIGVNSGILDCSSKYKFLVTGSRN